jgi:hypothetical protein
MWLITLKGLARSDKCTSGRFSFATDNKQARGPVINLFQNETYLKQITTHAASEGGLSCRVRIYPARTCSISCISRVR